MKSKQELLFKQNKFRPSVCGKDDKLSGGGGGGSGIRRNRLRLRRRRRRHLLLLPLLSSTHMLRLIKHQPS